MIYDFCENFHLYRFEKYEFWQQLFAFISDLTAELAPGRYPLQGEKLFVNVQEYQTKPLEAPANCLELHRRYLDIQLVLDGSERIFCRAGAGLAGRQPYSESSDCALLEFKPEGAYALPLYPGNFILLLPEEPHMPCIACREPAKVKKAVVKIDRRLLGI